MGRVAKRAVGSRKPQNRKVVTDDLTWETCSADPEQQLKGKVEAPGLSNWCPSLARKGRPCLSAEGEREIPRGQSPENGTRTNNTGCTRRNCTSATIEGQDQPRQAIARKGISEGRMSN